jgi:addiction module HigA family antidote
MTTTEASIKPDYAIPPGVTLQETIEFLGMSQSELAYRMDRPVKTINEIIKGKTAITPETALELEQVLGIPAKIWNNLETNYKSALAEQKQLAEQSQEIIWLTSFPVKELIKRGYVKETRDKSLLVKELFRFFGVANKNAWDNVWVSPQASFRKSAAHKISPESVASWIRIGELQAKNIQSQPYDKDKLKSVLVEARKLTTLAPQEFMPKLRSLCASVGIAFVFEPELPKTRVCGVTKWLSPEKALIQLSDRYKSDDHFWFTFFHEAAHILLHSKKETFIEYQDNDSDKEEEADQFSARFLIPDKDWSNFTEGKLRKIYSKASICAFSKQLGISPGIVVGRLQHEGLMPRNYCNELKLRLTWDSIT